MLTHNNKRITFSFCQTDELIEEGQVSQKIKQNDMIHFALFVGNVIPELLVSENSTLQQSKPTRYAICSEVQRIVDKKSVLCLLDECGKSIMIKTPVEAALQLGDKFKVSGTLKAELYKVERNEVHQDNKSIFYAIRRLFCK